MLADGVHSKAKGVQQVDGQEDLAGAQRVLQVMVQQQQGGGSGQSDVCVSCATRAVTGGHLKDKNTCLLVQSGERDCHTEGQPEPQRARQAALEACPEGQTATVNLSWSNPPSALPSAQSASRSAGQTHQSAAPSESRVSAGGKARTHTHKITGTAGAAIVRQGSALVGP